MLFHYTQQDLRQMSKRKKAEAQRFKAAKHD